MPTVIKPNRWIEQPEIPADGVPLKTWLFEYTYDGYQWGIEMRAATQEEARVRIRQVAGARFCGETLGRVEIPIRLISPEVGGAFLFGMLVMFLVQLATGTIF